MTEGEFEHDPALLGFEKALIHEKVQMMGLGEGRLWEEFYYYTTPEQNIALQSSS